MEVKRQGVQGEKSLFLTELQMETNQPWSCQISNVRAASKLSICLGQKTAWGLTELILALHLRILSLLYLINTSKNQFSLIAVKTNNKCNHITWDMSVFDIIGVVEVKKERSIIHFTALVIDDQRTKVDSLSNLTNLRLNRFLSGNTYVDVSGLVNHLNKFLQLKTQ